MEVDSLISLCSQSMLLCLLVSLPVVIVSAVVGLLVSFVQAITSLQEQSIGQAAKLIAVVVALLATAPWGASLVLHHAQELMRLATR